MQTEKYKPVIWPILMVENEWGDIADLDNILEEAQVGIFCAKRDMGPEEFPYSVPFEQLRVYVPYADDAIKTMKEMQSERGRFGAIITDNHLGGEGDSDLMGEDLLRIISGKPIYCITKNEDDAKIRLEKISECNNFREMFKLCDNYDKYRQGDEDNSVLELLESNFNNPKEYSEFVKYHFINETPYFLMLCGHPGEIDFTGIEDFVETQQKSISRERKGERRFCEKEVLNRLKERNIIPEEFIIRSVEEHPRLGKGVHPTNQIFREYRENKKNRKGAIFR